MLLIIGGPSCVGKSLLADKLMKQTGVPYFSMDYLKMGICRSNPGCGFTPTDSDQAIAKHLWPILREMIKTYIENEQDVIIEGCYILPEFLEELGEPYFRHILSVYLTFSEGYIRDNFESGIIASRSVVEQRLYDEDRSIEDFIQMHEETKAQCIKAMVVYNEIKEDYTSEMAEIERNICALMNLEFDQLIGLEERNGQPIIYRRAVRAICLRGGKVLMVRTNKGEYQLPGGGVDMGESDMSAIAREVYEETGYKCLEVRPVIGRTLERTGDRFKDGKLFEMTSYYYPCEVAQEASEQVLESYEAALEFTAVWMEPAEAIRQNNIYRKSIEWNDVFTVRTNYVLEQIRK